MNKVQSQAVNNCKQNTSLTPHANGTYFLFKIQKQTKNRNEM